MKNLKLLGLAAIALTALALAASSASATTLVGESPERTLGNGDVFDLSIPSGKFVALLDTEGVELDSCTTSTVKSKLSTGTTGTIEELTWANCRFPTNTITKGKLEVVSTGGTTGEVRADATIEVTINTMIFGTCIYGLTSGTTAGSLAGNPAILTVNAVAEKFSGSNFVCPSTARWTGTYNATSTNFHVES